MDIRTYVTNRLRSFGIEPTTDDEFTVGFCIDRAEAEIRAQTNLADLPSAVFPMWADMAVGYSWRYGLTCSSGRTICVTACALRLL